MATMDMHKAREEFLIFLRNSDILSITQRGVTTKTDNLTSTEGQTIFSLTSYNVRNIRSVTVETVAQNVYKDYTPTYNTGSASTITFGTGLSADDAVAIQYDHSATMIEKVWPDYPDIAYLPTDCPRVGFDFISMRTTPIGLAPVNWITDALVRTKFYDLGTYLTIDHFITTFRAAVKAAQTSFYHFQIAHIGSIGPANPIVVGKIGKVFERYCDVTMRFNFES